MTTPAVPHPILSVRPLSLLNLLGLAGLGVVDLGMVAAASKLLLSVPAMCLTANARGAGELAGWVFLASASALLVVPLLGALRSYRCLAQDDRPTTFLFARLFASTGLIAGGFWTGHLMMPHMVLSQGGPIVLGEIIALCLLLLGSVVYSIASLPFAALLVGTLRSSAASTR